MGKMGELAAQLSELKRCGEILIGISDSLADLFSGEPGREENCGQNVCKKGNREKDREGHDKGSARGESTDAGGSPSGTGGQIPRRTHGGGQGTA